MGLWVLAGIFSFIAIEKLFQKGSETEQEDVPCVKSNGAVTTDVYSQGDGVYKRRTSATAASQNGHVNGSAVHMSSTKQTSHKDIAGYLNLLANSIDNYTHGLAVGASFLINMKVGTLTTLAILLHEVPHEISDFAILLKSGFNRWEAAKAQFATAGIGLLGAMTALSAKSSPADVDQSARILLFTAGGFINIALVAVLPDLMKEQDPRESMKQLACMLLGTTLMAAMTCIT
jgi:zinc transporter 13